jgi:LmbE family N-acetylglucosaminyl deacetylase
MMHRSPGSRAPGRVPVLAAVLSAMMLATLALAPTPAAAEEPPRHAGILAHTLDRLATTGRVLYIGAHPDDENTRLLAYLANSRHLSAAYLSMTRGGGGQNLIGHEQDELLDVIRTEELLAARRLDGATQRFTRMRDFGYSKTAEETLAIWDHEEALADVVWVLRTFQPDVIITRFDEQPPNHGHHTASAILAREAFSAAADPKRFPQQLTGGVEPWQAERLLLNVPQWREGPPPADAIALDVGEYDPRLGLGYGELAARSRSQHKSQGFGVAGERGPLIERFVSVAGTKPTTDIMEGVTTSWERFGKPGAALAKALEKARATLERDRPEQALPALLKAQQAFDALPDVPRVRDARVALDQVLAAAAGVFVRATAAHAGGVPGSVVPVHVEILLRRPASMRLRRVVFPNVTPVEVDAVLALSEKKEVAGDVPIPADAAVSAPYWLAEPSLHGRQVVSDQRLVGEPKGPPPLAVGVELGLDDRIIRLDVPVVYAWTDPVQGERARSFLVLPPATVTPQRQAVMFPNGKAAPVVLRIRAGKDDVHGDVSLRLPASWRAVPATMPVTLAHAGDETTVRFQVTPPANASSVDVFEGRNSLRSSQVGDGSPERPTGAAHRKDAGRSPSPVEIHPAIDVGGTTWSYREDVIDYPHIPMQVVLQPARLRLVPLALRLPPGPIGYIPGSGDTVADDLAHVGLTVEVIDEDKLRTGDLSRYRAIVVGIRAYNTRDVLRNVHERLMHYVENGGTLIVQYNTNNRLAPLEIPIGPFPLTIGRDRVTDENAAMVAVNPQHPVLLTPNRIGADDFTGWVQERGLYYAESWDQRYEPIFRAADPGEPPLLGGLLVAPYGRGRYVYTGLGFFRQLPAGVPGAYRLFANLIAAR